MACDQIYIGIGIAIGSMQYRLMNMRESCIFIGVRITLKMDDTLLTRASRLTEFRGKTALGRLGLEFIISRESSEQLAALGGTEKRRHGPS
jgi:hypothetical protein